MSLNAVAYPGEYSLATGPTAVRRLQVLHNTIRQRAGGFCSKPV
jgi:hypothetical protein